MPDATRNCHGFSDGCCTVCFDALHEKKPETANENFLLALRKPVSTEILVAIAAILAIAALYYLFVRKRE